MSEILCEPVCESEGERGSVQEAARVSVCTTQCMRVHVRVRLLCVCVLWCLCLCVTPVHRVRGLGAVAPLMPVPGGRLALLARSPAGPLRATLHTIYVDVSKENTTTSTNICQTAVCPPRHPQPSPFRFSFSASLLSLSFSLSLALSLSLSFPLPLTLSLSLSHSLSLSLSLSFPLPLTLSLSVCFLTDLFFPKAPCGAPGQPGFRT